MCYTLRHEACAAMMRIGLSLRLGAVFLFAVMALMGPGASTVHGAPVETGTLWPAEIEGWKIAEGPTRYDPNTAYTYMDGAAELFIAYNMKDLTVVRYESKGRPAITLEIYRMGSSEDASGLFTFESDDPGAGIGQGSEFGGGLLRFWKGRCFVTAYGDGTGPELEAGTLALGRKVASAITETGNPPAILGLLPPGKEPYVRGQTWFFRSHILLNQRFFISNANILGLAPDVEAALGRYGTGKDRVHMLIVKYPTTERAERAIREFGKVYMGGAAAGTFVKKESGRWSGAERYDNYVIIVFDGPDKERASGMLAETAPLLKKEGK